RSKDANSTSLLGFMDKTKTSMGARHLKHFFQSPLCEAQAINRRLDLVQSLMGRPDILKELRTVLDDVRDIDRIMAKVSTGKANAGDLLNLARSTSAYFTLQELMDKGNF